MKTQLDVAERRGDIPALLEYLQVYGYVLNNNAQRLREVSGRDFAAAIRRVYDTTGDNLASRVNGLMADVAERYVVSVFVWPDSSCQFRVMKDRFGRIRRADFAAVKTN